jgi:hypothetical protein
MGVLWCLEAALVTAQAQNWLQTTAPTNDWRAIASSADGTKLVAAASPGFIYTSADSGNSWTPCNAPSNYFSTPAFQSGNRNP